MIDFSVSKKQLEAVVSRRFRFNDVTALICLQGGQDEVISAFQTNRFLLFY